MLSPRLADLLPSAFEGWASQDFDHNADGELRGHSPDAADPGLTSGYVIYLPELWPGGCTFALAFGMGQNETLAFTHLLRESAQINDPLVQVFRSNRPSLLMARFEMDRLPTPPVPIWMASMEFLFNLVVRDVVTIPF